MSFKPLITIKEAQEPARTRQNSGKTMVSGGSKPKKRGCEFCPLNEVKGINKVFGKVRGRKIFIWAQSPGHQENKVEKELVGPSGEFLWHELKRVGITRDMCDIQNVVRCIPADRVSNMWPPLQMRTPSKEEVKCCSVYNEKALAKSKARIHLIFGGIAGAVLLQKEYKKDKRVFYSDAMGGWVVYLDHPSYFIRQGYRAGSKDKVPNDALIRFRQDLKRAAAILAKKKLDRFDFVKKQNYIGITTTKLARMAYRRLKRAASKGKIIVADMEEGRLDKRGRPDDNGTSRALCCGFTADAGTTYVYALEHPDSGADARCRRYNRKLVRRLMADNHIRKAFQYGASDTDAVARLLKTKVRRYVYDTLLASFFNDPDAKAYGLDAVSTRSYPDFMDYKDIIGPESFTREFRKQFDSKKKLTLGQKVDLAKKKGMINLARLPWPKMVVYNGADNHLSKLIQEDTQKSGNVNQALMQIYIDTSFITYRMEREKQCKPLFDYDWHAKLSKLIPIRVKNLKRKLCHAAGKYAYLRNKKTGEKIKKKFNPGSPDHINWLIYKKWKCRFVAETEKDKPNTKANTLKRLSVDYPKVAIIPEYRAATKMESTYLDGYYNCAELNDGHLRTNWKLTGTGSGRISSGKKKDQSDDHVINFQNIHGDPLIKCLLVSDTQWRDLYDDWKEHTVIEYTGKNKQTGQHEYSVEKAFFNEKNWVRYEDLNVFLGFDFSQMELRVLCQESRDKGLIKMFSMGTDPHVEVGHALTGWPKEAIAKDDRRRKLIKNMQFGLVYGLKGLGLFKFLIAQGVKTTQKEVDDYHAKYFEQFPGVRVLYDESKDFLQKYGYVENLFGFRRKINIHKQEDDEDYDGAYWGNQALNTKIQGAAGQMLLFSLAMLHRKPDHYNLLQAPQLEIHDALYFRQKLKRLWKAMAQGKELMVKEPVRIAEEEFDIEWKVPLQAKPKAGFRFGVQVEGIGGDKMRHEWDFLNEWCLENYKLEKQYKRELAEFAN